LSSMAEDTAQLSCTTMDTSLLAPVQLVVLPQDPSPGAEGSLPPTGLMWTPGLAADVCSTERQHQLLYVGELHVKSGESTILPSLPPTSSLPPGVVLATIVVIQTRFVHLSCCGVKHHWNLQC